MEGSDLSDRSIRAVATGRAAEHDLMDRGLWGGDPEPCRAPEALRISLQAT